MEQLTFDQAALEVANFLLETYAPQVANTFRGQPRRNMIDNVLAGRPIKEGVLTDRQLLEV